jgi:DNA-binding CsgD family transcriptional regulator
MSKFKYQNQTEIILDWYKYGKSYAEIARLLNSDNIIRDAGNIRRLLRSLLGNIHGNPKVIITPEVENQIKILLDRGMNQKQISELLQIKYPTLGTYFQKKGIKFLPNPGNIHYFDKIDTYAKAYILGFIAADGSLVQANKSPTITLTITVKYEDKAVLEFIKSEIGNTHKLLEIKRPSSFDKTKMIHHIRYNISIPEIVHDIMKYGITPRKSLTMGNIIENIPIGFRDAFIIGYFDGDGSVHIETKPRKNNHNKMYNDNSLYINIRGTKSFLEGICDHLNIDKSHIYQHDSIPNLAFANKKDTYRFYQCYQYLPFYYKRKHDKFLARINHPSYDKYKQDQTISSSVA